MSQSPSLSKVPGSTAVLDPANDPARAHKGLDDMLAEVKGPASVVVTVYEPGMRPRSRYYGRTLNQTEWRGVVMSLMLDDADG